MFRIGHSDKSFKSAHSGRRTQAFLAPPFLIYSVFAISIFLQIPAGYIIHHFSFTFGMLISQVGTILLPALIAINIFGLTKKAVLPFKKITFRQVALIIIMMCSLAVISDYLMFITEKVLPITKPLDELYNKLMYVDSVGMFINKFAFLCIVPSFCEEMFFRGFCQTGLEHHYGRTGGIVVAAAMFSVAHLSPWYIHLYFILGLFLSWLFATSGSLWIPIICHITNNLWTFILHTAGWKMPLIAERVWWNIPVLVISTAVLILTIFGWRRLHVQPS